MIISATKGHSIWLLPEPTVSARISASIAQLSRLFGSALFQPHLTLLGQIPGDRESLLFGFRKLEEEFTPFSIKPESIGTLDTFYRALFYKIARSPHLEARYVLAKTRFVHASEAPFFPHISLLYSSASESKKRQAISTLQIETPAEIPITHIVLMQTRGEVSDWELIERIKLG